MARHGYDEAVCQRCGVAFMARRDSKKMYCSPACRAASRHVQFTKSCAQCGVPFQRGEGESAGGFRLRQTCSSRCGNLLGGRLSAETRKANPKPQPSTKIPFTCQVCGKQWLDIPSAQGRKKFCSRECATQGMVTKEERTCVVCAKPYWCRPSRPERMTCSHSCGSILLVKRLRIEGRITNPEVLTCDQCGGSYVVSRYRGKDGKQPAKYCSRRCQNKAARGAKGPRVERVPYTCQVCGFKGLAERWENRKYCSHRCNGVAQTRRMAEQSPTTIETEVYSVLSEMGIAFEPQCVVDYYLVDAFLLDLGVIVEVQGDYFHCNPSVYPDGPINDLQRNSIRRDKIKLGYFKKLGYPVIQLWEKDIRSEGVRALLGRLL